MRWALILLALCASAWGQQAPELTRERAMELWPVYVETQRAPNAPGAIVARLNMYRQAAGLGPVVVDAALNPGSQQCARVLALNPTWVISHTLPRTLEGWTAAAATAARNGCIDRYDDGARAVADFVRDWGMTALNKYVGHRRWLMHPGLQTVGVGAVASSLGNPAAVCIYVRTPMAASTQAVAWPPAGDVPIGWVPERWSYSAPGCDLSAAAVWMDGRRVSVARQAGTSPPGVIVWQPVLPFNVESRHTVRIEGLPGGLVEYEVRRFRP